MCSLERCKGPISNDTKIVGNAAVQTDDVFGSSSDDIWHEYAPWEGERELFPTTPRSLETQLYSPMRCLVQAQTIYGMNMLLGTWR